jgi:hypothetical protein
MCKLKRKMGEAGFWRLHTGKRKKEKRKKNLILGVL